jgi:hypothetical protein
MDLAHLTGQRPADEVMRRDGIEDKALGETHPVAKYCQR